MPEVLTTAGVSRRSCALTDAKTRLYLSGVLDHCVHILSLDPRSLRGSWSSVTTLAQLARWLRFTVQTKVPFRIRFKQVLINVSEQLLLRRGGTWPAFRVLSQAPPAVAHGRPPLIGRPPGEAGRGEKLLPLVPLPQLFVESIGLNPSVSQCVSLFRKVMTDSVGRLFRAHTQLAAQGRSLISSHPALISLLILVLNGRF